MQPVKAAAKRLDDAILKKCSKCGGDGKIKRRGEGAVINRPVFERCEECNGKGDVPNDPKKIETAAFALVTSVVRMAPDTPGADIALSAAYETITEKILKNQTLFRQLNDSSAGLISQIKPQPGKMAIVKCIFGYELQHPDLPDQKVFIMRVANKKQIVAVVSPKQADPPQAGGRVLAAGVISGSIDAEDGGKRERVVILEQGFLIAPNLDLRWWDQE